MPDVPIRQRWSAKGGSLLGGFRIGKAVAVPLAGRPFLMLLDDDSIIVKASYDPPSSALLAFLATAATSFAAAFAVGLLGIGIAPSWFLWYLVIVLLRRSPIILNLADADSVVVDPATSRVAFHVPFEGSERWFAVAPVSRASAALDAVRAKLPAKVSEGSIAGPNLAPIVLMLVFSIACFAFVIWCAVR